MGEGVLGLGSTEPGNKVTPKGGNAGLSKVDGESDRESTKEGTEGEGDGTGEHSAGGDVEPLQGADGGKGEGAEEPDPGDVALDPTGVAAKFEMVDKLLAELSTKSSKLSGTVRDLRESLEFSQKEIDTLKGENAELRSKMAGLKMEEKRSTYQMGKIEEKIDRVDTANRRKNLIFEGIPEEVGEREDMVKMVWKVFDQLQLKIDKQMDFDACYHQGAPSKNRLCLCEQDEPKKDARLQACLDQ